MASFPSVSVVVPVYNSEGTLRELAARVKTALQPMPFFEMILVNDGSRDGSWAVIRELSKEHSFISGFNLFRNFGQHNALLCGVRQAKGDVTVTMDDDLQQQPEDILKLIQKLNEGTDVVYGVPEKEKQSFFRNLSSKFIKYSLEMSMGVKAARNASPFRAFRTKMRDAFESYGSPFVSLDVLLSWGTTRFDSVPVQFHPRKIGRSGYNFKKLLVHAVNMVTGFSIIPLHLVSILGFCLTVMGFLMICYVVGRFFIEGGSVPGFPFLASSFALFSGAQLFALGIIGEYLARMHFRMMGRPVYIIRESTKDKDRE